MKKYLALYSILSCAITYSSDRSPRELAINRPKPTFTCLCASASAVACCVGSNLATLFCFAIPTGCAADVLNTVRTDLKKHNEEITDISNRLRQLEEANQKSA